MTVTGGHGGICIVHIVKITNGTPHLHEGYDEVYLSGTGTITLSQETYPLRPGCCSRRKPLRNLVSALHALSAARRYFDQHHNNTAEILLPICYQSDHKKRKKDSRPIAVSPYLITSTGGGT